MRLLRYAAFFSAYVFIIGLVVLARPDHKAAVLTMPAVGSQFAGLGK